MDTVWATITAIVDRHARIAPTPSELAARIPEMLADIRAKHPIHDTETTLLFLAAVFGPRELGRPPEETLVELRLLAATGGSLAEAVVVYGCRLPLSAIGWALRWERSVHALALMLETIVTGSTRWIHANIGERERGITVREDVRTIARFLAEVLASDHCSLCAAKWDDLRLESLERALSHCVEHHSLSTWQPGTSLEKFLYFSSEHSRSRQSLASRINDFRKGMHAKIAASGRLTAGYVMRCDCGSEYLANNRCQGCDSTGGVEEPRSWWLWIEHDRRRTGARNCNVCRRYFHYTPGATCPVGHADWSHRDFGVWVRERNLPFDEAWDLPVKPILDWSRLERGIAERLSANSVEAAVAKLVLLDRLELDAAARAAGFKTNNVVFTRVLYDVYRRLQDLIPNAPDVEDET